MTGLGVVGFLDDTSRSPNAQSGVAHQTEAGRADSGGSGFRRSGTAVPQQPVPHRGGTFVSFVRDTNVNFAFAGTVSDDPFVLWPT